MKGEKSSTRVRVKAPGELGKQIPSLEIEVPAHLVPDAEAVERVFLKARGYAAPVVGAVFFGVAIYASVREALDRAKREKGVDHE